VASFHPLPTPPTHCPCRTFREFTLKITGFLAMFAGYEILQNSRLVPQNMRPCPPPSNPSTKSSTKAIQTTAPASSFHRCAGQHNAKRHPCFRWFPVHVTLTLFTPLNYALSFERLTAHASTHNLSGALLQSNQLTWHRLGGSTVHSAAVQPMPMTGPSSGPVSSAAR
jgi:hypothetical protein